MTEISDDQEQGAMDGKVRKSILIPEDTLKTGQRRAREEMRNFSNYVCWLIEQDKAAKQPSTAEVGA